MRIYDVMSASLRVLVLFTCVHTLAYTEFSPSRTNVYPYQTVHALSHVPRGPGPEHMTDEVGSPI